MLETWTLSVVASPTREPVLDVGLELDPRERYFQTFMFWKVFGRSDPFHLFTHPFMVFTYNLFPSITAILFSNLCATHINFIHPIPQAQFFIFWSDNLML